MQLWKKSYVITMIALTVILNIGMSLLVFYSFRSDYQQAAKSAAYEVNGIAYSYLGLYNFAEDDSNAALKSLNSQYARNKVYTKAAIILESGEEVVITSNLPGDEIEYGDTKLREISLGKERYLTAHSEQEVEDGTLCITYMKQVTSVYRNHYVRIGIGMFVVLLISFLLYIILYQMMKHIYKPVNNIAHELRTPLTNINGYAQYIKSGNLSSEDIYFAGGIIEREAKNLNAIVERLLVMGNVREGTIHMEPVELKRIIENLKQQGSSIEILTALPCVIGDEVLLRCMFGNLIDNGVKEAGSVRVSAEENRVYIVNDGKIEEPRILQALNKNKKLAVKDIKRNGYGISLCHEIAKMHQAKLEFCSTKRNETVVCVSFLSESGKR